MCSFAEGDITRYVGDAIAHRSNWQRKKSLDEVLALVEVDYTELEPVVDPLEALKPDAPQLHPNGNVLSRQTLSRGDVE